LNWLVIELAIGCLNWLSVTELVVGHERDNQFPETSSNRLLR
jgi:hypothetical protein